MHRIRNPAYWFSSTEGSNPSLSAKLLSATFPTPTPALARRRSDCSFQISGVPSRSGNPLLIGAPSSKSRPISQELLTAQARKSKLDQALSETCGRVMIRTDVKKSGVFPRPQDNMMNATGLTLVRKATFSQQFP